MAIELIVNEYNSWTSETLFSANIAIGANISGYYSGFELGTGNLKFNYGQQSIWQVDTNGITFLDSLIMPEVANGSLYFPDDAKITNSSGDLSVIAAGSISFLQKLSVMGLYGTDPGIEFESTGCGIGYDAAADNIFLKNTDGTDTATYNFGLSLFQVPDGLSIGGNLSVTGDISVTGTAPWLTAETDPVFTSHIAYGITGSDTTNWDTAFSWGDHSTEGYLTAIPTSLNQNLSILGDLSCSQLLTAGGGISILDGEISMTNLSTLADGLALQTTMIILQPGYSGETLVDPSIIGAKTYLAMNEDATDLGTTGYLSQTCRLIDSTAGNDPDNCTYHSADDYICVFGSMVFSDYSYDGTDIVDTESTVAAGIMIQAAQDHSSGALGTRLIFANVLNDTSDINVGAMLDGDGSFSIYGDFLHRGNNLAFFDGTACSQQTVTTSGTTEATVASIVSALEAMNLIAVAS